MMDPPPAWAAERAASAAAMITSALTGVGDDDPLEELRRLQRGEPKATVEELFGLARVLAIYAAHFAEVAAERGQEDPLDVLRRAALAWQRQPIIEPRPPPDPG